MGRGCDAARCCNVRSVLPDPHFRWWTFHSVRPAYAVSMARSGAIGLVGSIRQLSEAVQVIGHLIAPAWLKRAHRRARTRRQRGTMHRPGIPAPPAPRRQLRGGRPQDQRCDRAHAAEVSRQRQPSGSVRGTCLPDDGQLTCVDLRVSATAGASVTPAPVARWNFITACRQAIVDRRPDSGMTPSAPETVAAGAGGIVGDRLLEIIAPRNPRSRQRASSSQRSSPMMRSIP